MSTPTKDALEPVNFTSAADALEASIQQEQHFRDDLLKMLIRHSGGQIAKDEEQYLSVKQLSSRIPYAESSIRNMMGAGTFREGTHYFKRGARVMFKWSAVQSWVEGQDQRVEAPLPLVRNKAHGS